MEQFPVWPHISLWLTPVSAHMGPWVRPSQLSAPASFRAGSTAGSGRRRRSWFYPKQLSHNLSCHTRRPWCLARICIYPGHSRSWNIKGFLGIIVRLWATIYGVHQGFGVECLAFHQRTCQLVHDTLSLSTQNHVSIPNSAIPWSDFKID